MAEQEFHLVDTRNEQAAVHMANAYGRLTGSPAISLFTTPGQANAVGGLTFAHHMGAPVVNVVGCAESHTLGKGASQELDQVGMARPVTKGSWLLPSPDRIPEYMARPFAPP